MTTSHNNLLIVKLKPPLAWLTLNRPDAMNSLNTDLLLAMQETCRDLSTEKSASKSISVVIITGGNNKVFCAGADLKERRGMTDEQTSDYLNLIRNTFLAIEQLPQVVIAAINGSAFGGGTELALACDLRIMLKQATLALTEVTLGIIPGAGGTQRLSRLIGKSLAKEIILTATPISAERAFNTGLVNKLSSDNLIPDTESWATSIARAAPLSLRHAKQAIDEGYEKNLSEGLEIEAEHYNKLLATLDRQEALKAFSEKRSAHFTGQ
jgi:methylglutaconyl-CoA hydratase